MSKRSLVGHTMHSYYMLLIAHVGPYPMLQRLGLTGPQNSPYMLTDLTVMSCFDEIVQTRGLLANFEQDDRNLN